MKYKNENFPGGIGVGLNLPNGYINGAPTGSADEIYDPIAEILHKAVTEEDFNAFVLEYLGEAPNKALDQDITYTNTNGQQKKIKARDALRLPKDHPAHIQAAKIAGPDDAPANEPKAKEEPGKAAQAAAKPSQPGQPVKKGQTAQGKTDKEKPAGGAAGETPQGPPPEQKLGGAELKSSAETNPSEKKKDEFKQAVDNARKELSDEENKTIDKVNNPDSPERKGMINNIKSGLGKVGNSLRKWGKHKKEMVKGTWDAAKALAGGQKIGSVKNKETGKWEYSDEKRKEQIHHVKHFIKDAGLLIGSMALGGAGVAAAKAIGAGAGAAGVAGAAGKGAIGAFTHGLGGFGAHLGKDLAKHSALEVMGMGGTAAAGGGAVLSVATGGLLEIVNEDVKNNEQFISNFMKKVVEKMETYQLSDEQLLKSIQSYKKNKPKQAAADLLKETITETKQQSIQHFVEFATKRLKLQETPKVNLVGGGEFAEIKTSLGGFDPETKEIYVATEGRLTADILRTLAHEMVHRKQDEMGLVRNPMQDGADGSPIENQAHAVAGILMREYGRINKQIYKEDINIDVDKGDTVLMGKFKNKKVTVKDIDKDTHGMPTINGKKATTFRLSKEGHNVYTHKPETKSDFDFINKHKSDIGIPANDDTIDFDGKKNGYKPVSEMGSKDIHFANMIKLYRDFKFRKRINAYLFGNPNGYKANDVARALRNMGYDDITQMEKELNIKLDLKEVSNVTKANTADVPDGSFIAKGKKRKLDSDKSEDWYKNGGYTQTDFPKADAIFGDEDAEERIVKYTIDNLPNIEFTPTKFIKEELLTEGGAAGHLAHPFEDADLKFSDMKEMIKRGLIGGLDKEAPVSEKLDGQNIAFTVRDGKIRFGRNKGHVKNSGENALDVDGIIKQFAGRGGIEKAFGGAAEDLQAAVQKLGKKEVEKMFGNGSKFMSLEIILPDTTNVIPYGKSVLVMHGTIEYDKEGNQIDRSTEDATTFTNAVIKAGADKQKTFGIEGPKTIVFSSTDSKEYEKKAKEYSDQLTKVQKEYGLNDKSKLEDYRKKWWERKIDSEAKAAGIKLSNSEKNGLVKRWANGDKGFGVKNFTDDNKQQWFRNFEENKLQAAQKQMIKPIETTFLNVGAQTLKRVTNFLASNNPKSGQQLKKETLDAIKAIKDSKDPDKIAKLQIELERLNSIGMDKIVPSEGVVFQYGGKPYKFTGAFAPINQINGTFKFDKPKKDEVKKGENEIAIFSGRFQPFHQGHYSIYADLVRRFGKDNVYIATSNVTDPVKSPFNFSDKKKIITGMFDIPANRVVKVKNPYAPEEILSKYPKDTKYVTAVSQKDADRLERGGKYFKNYDKTKSKKGYEDEGYFIVNPEMQLNVNGKNISGTQLRATFGNQILSKPEKEKIFRQIYPKFDKTIFNQIVSTTTASEKEKSKQSEKSKSKPQGKTKVTSLEKLKTKIKSLSPAAKKRVAKTLQTKIKNPDTGRTINVKSALGYDDKKLVKKNAIKLVQQAIGKN